MEAIEKLIDAYDTQMRYSTHVIAFVDDTNAYLYTANGLLTLSIDDPELKKYESVVFCKFFNTNDTTPENVENLFT